MGRLWTYLMGDDNRNEPAVVKHARRAKFSLQMLIGIFIVLFLVYEVACLFYQVWQGHPAHFSVDPLATVGEALGLSAAVDLAFMLFTPGPDEAVEPIIIGIAATILILASRFKEWLPERGPDIWLVWPVLCIVLLVGAMALLFVIRDKFFDTTS